MDPWWVQWPGRLEAELDAFRAHDLVFRLDEEEKQAGRIVLRGEAPIDDVEATELIVVYPDTFPNTRFAIYAPKLDLPRHQNPLEGNLCVLPRGSDHWHPKFLAGDFIASDVPKLVELVRIGGEALQRDEDPQGEPFSEYYPYSQIGGVLVPDAALKIHASHMRGRFQLRFVGDPGWIDHMVDQESAARPRMGQALLQKVLDLSGEVVAEADPELSSLCEGPTWFGTWIRLETAPRTIDPNAFVQILGEAHPKLVKWKLEQRTSNARFDIIAIVFSEEVQQGRYEDCWVFCVVGSRGKTSSKPTHVTLLRGLRLGSEDLRTRIPELSNLRSKKVSLIGLGTLGAPVAHELVRSGIRRLALADDDHVNAGTSVRWLYGVRAAGAQKAPFLKSEFGRDYPYTQVEDHILLVGETPLERREKSEARRIQAWLQDADLLIDATAEANVSRAVSQIAWRQSIPYIVLWSIDGYGGVVARLEPGRTGCFHCLELALADGGHVEAPTSAIKPDSIRIQPRGCADPTFTGAAVDLMPLANQASRLALGFLCRESADGYPDYPADVFVYQVRLPDGALADVPDWRSYQLPPNSSCPLCFSDGR